MMLREIVYWRSLADEKMTSNSASISVDIPKTNIVNCKSLDNILARIAEEELI